MVDEIRDLYRLPNIGEYEDLDLYMPVVYSFCLLV